MDICDSKIKNGILIRYIITILVFYILSLKIDTYYKYIYLILPILLTLFDNVDNIFTFSYKNNNCTKSYYYQYNDKICDIISYLLLFSFFKLDNSILFFIFYRIIGVILFYFTKNTIWLVIFFDFVKEYLIYMFIFQNNYNYILPILILFKIIFEYYFHNVTNKLS